MTGPAVDLAAVRDVRRALAAIVAEHPELTGAPARARLAEHLPEIITMKPLDSNATGPARTITVRLSADLIAHLATERDRLAALVPGASLGLSDAVRSFILRAVALPSTSAPAAPAAPAPMRPVAAPVVPVEAPAVDPRQLPLLAPAAPVVALHNAANGASVATITGNDNGASPAASTPKPKRTRATSPAQGTDGPVIDLDALLTRHLAAIAAGRSERAITKAAGLSESTLTRWRNGHRGLTSDVAAKADAALRKLGF